MRGAMALKKLTCQDCGEVFWSRGNKKRCYECEQVVVKERARNRAKKQIN